MSLAMLSSSIKGSALKSIRVSAPLRAATAVSRPTSVWTSRFYSTDKENGAKESESQDKATNATQAEGAEQPKQDSTKSPQEEALAAKDKQIAEIKDRLLRTLADMENLRQRTSKEVSNTKEYAIQKFAKDLLDTADILAMAIKNIPAEEIAESSTNTHLKSLHTGVSMTRDELLKTFKRYGVEAYDPLNEKFDPNLHQANFQVPMPGKEPGTVFDVQKIGYMLKGRVLRPAQVGVVQSTD
ncbi:Mitochondrial matrix cochaperone [Lunasporangiospora selenospora]|uniref:GrpE protein homolog n=1 Tax=Lunasporangiospora selenospora TaxID=979761 RepID=A0A9P6KHY4_9FUNG|nr:Mitochondrial matrix cochaperone [Lunasporangiospora selenospora]